MLAALAVVSLVGVGVWLFWAARQVPDWYAEAVAVDDSAAIEKASDQMEQRIAELISAFETTGRWEVLITEEQINGWLSHGLPKKHPDALPNGLTDPRVKIEPDGVTGAGHVELGAAGGVVSLKVDFYATEEHCLAARIRKARLGRMPWPLNRVLEEISGAAKRSEVPLAWREVEGDPVAVIRIPLVEGDKRVHIETLKLDHGKLLVGGVTERVK
ncbi:MAG TPA: hypothetical protein DD670_00670 [Planctomycetaceae bacterium]|nr:hypothetical protein [Planctomycetaceae bacterium]